MWKLTVILLILSLFEFVLSGNLGMTKVDKDYPKLFPKCDLCAEIRDVCTVDYWKDYMGCGCDDPGGDDCDVGTYFPIKVKVKKGKLIKRKENEEIPDESIKKILKKKDDLIAHLKTNKKGEFKAVFQFNDLEEPLDYRRGLSHLDEDLIIVLRFKGNDKNKSPWNIKLYRWEDLVWRKIAKLSKDDFQEDDSYKTYYKKIDYGYDDNYISFNGKLKLILKTKNNKPTKELMNLNILQVTLLRAAHDDQGIYSDDPCEQEIKTC